MSNEPTSYSHTMSSAFVTTTGMRYVGCLLSYFNANMSPSAWVMERRLLLRASREWAALPLGSTATLDSYDPSAMLHSEQKTLVARLRIEILASSGNSAALELCHSILQRGILEQAPLGTRKFHFSPSTRLASITPSSPGRSSTMSATPRRPAPRSQRQAKSASPRASVTRAGPR